MYKLTYETDDDLDGDNITNTDGFSKKTDNETVIHEKSENIYSQPWSMKSSDRRTSHMETDGKKDTATSTRKAAFSGKHVKTEANTKSDKKKFYSLFTNSSSSTPRKRESRSCRGLQAWLLVLYLFVLTAAVIVLFVFLKKFKDENDALKEQVRFLSGSNQLPNEAVAVKSLNQLYSNQHLRDSPPPPPPPPLENPENSADVYECCDTSWKSVRDFRAKLSRTSDQLGTLQLVTQKNFDSIDQHFIELENNLTNLAKQFGAIEFMKKELQLINLFESEEEEASVQSNIPPTANDFIQQPKQETAAFHVIRAAEYTITDDITPEMPNDQRTTVFFTDELINQGQHMDLYSGIFTTPLEGVYVFFLSFCTEITSNQAVEVALMKNTATARTFRVPIVTENSTTFILPYDMPSQPLNGPSGRSTSAQNGIVAEHRYTVMLELQENDEIMLKLTSGAIVELAMRNGRESQYCTEFSGYKIN